MVYIHTFWKEQIEYMFKEMCASGGIKGNKTNHSLRSFGVTTLFEKNVPEKLIQEHRRPYMCTRRRLTNN